MGAAPLLLPLHCCLLQSGPIQLLLARLPRGHSGPQLYTHQGHLNVHNLCSYCIRIRTRDVRSNLGLCLLEFPRAKPKGTEKGLFLTIYPKLSPNTDIINFSRIFTNNFFIVLQGRIILGELILSISLSGRAILHRTLPRGYVSQDTPWVEYSEYRIQNTVMQF